MHTQLLLKARSYDVKAQRCHICLHALNKKDFSPRLITLKGETYDLIYLKSRVFFSFVLGKGKESE